MLRCPPVASALQVRRCQSSTLRSGVRGLGAELSPSVRIRVETSASGLLHKLPMLGKLFSFSGKSSLYRTGVGSVLHHLKRHCPKTEANLLMHSDLGGLGRQWEQRDRVREQRKRSRRLRAESKNTSYSTLAKKRKDPQHAPGSSHGWEALEEQSDLGVLY